MRYELLLQPLEAGAVFDAAALNALLDGRGASGASKDGQARSWRLVHGSVEVRPVIEAGRQVAVEVRIPLSESTDLVREAVVESARLAQDAKLRLFDPQLLRPLSATDESAVADNYLRTARYAGEVLALPEAVAAGFQPADSGRSSLMPKLVIGAVLLLAILMWLSDRLLE